MIDNGAYGARIRQIAEAYGIAHDVESFGVGGYPDLERIDKRLRERRYTQLAVIHHETSTGVLNPVEAIGKLCKAAGVEMIVDAMSSYAGIPIDIERMGADFLVSSSNKCIQGMAGLAFVICKRARLERDAADSGALVLLQPVAPPPLLRGRRPDAVHAAGPDRLCARAGAARILRRRREKTAIAAMSPNWETLDGGMLALGFRRLLPEAILSRILTCYLEPDHPRYDFGEMHDRLYAKGFTIYPGKGANKATFRLANMGDVNSDDMRAFIDAMRDTIGEMNIRPLYGS